MEKQRDKSVIGRVARSGEYKVISRDGATLKVTVIPFNKGTKEAISRNLEKHTAADRPSRK
jgi:hypothetical protein